MVNKDSIKIFNSIFPNYISDQFLFPIDNYVKFLEGLSINPLSFFSKWSDINKKYNTDKYWRPNTNLDWKWSLAFPLFSLLEKYNNINNPIIIGFSGLPGSGKSSLGFWINSVARELDLDINVISLDDFYLPAIEMDIAMKDNPWNVPRGFPGSHSVELLYQSLDSFKKTGILRSPIFEKALRNGKGDRLGWRKLSPKVLILEGWFVGCEPISDLKKLDELSDEKFKLCLSQIEKIYRNSIQESLTEYVKIWKMFHKVWHLKSSQFNNIVKWKKQQEEEMIKLKGSGLSGQELNNFIRMIQVSIPQQSLTFIKSDTTIEINQSRRIDKLYTNIYKF